MAEGGGPLVRPDPEPGSPPLLRGRPSEGALTDQILAPIWQPSPIWRLLFALSAAGALLFLITIVYSVGVGVGVWGNNIPVAWGFPIVNFVWWIGIGHAGTFISAFLLLMGQRWRASINRVAEAMTLFALVNAGIFPLLHLGRVWLAYWLFPYPSTMDVWPQFKSSLPWDVAAILTYFVISLLFWYLGLIPDLATARDRAPKRLSRRVYGALALGWRGSARQWRQHRRTMVLLAALATPLVISVHSIVSTDFALALIPGWHSTLFPPYFVAGAIYSGLAMVLALMIPLRRAFGFENLITTRHLDHVAKLLLATAWMVIYSYVVETFVGWYSADPFERHTYLVSRLTGPYAWLYWGMLAVNIGVPQLFWARSMRRDVRVLFGASILVLVAMWAERFLIVVESLSMDFLPSSWALFSPTWVDLGMLVGSLGLFFTLFLLFVRYVPIVPIYEVKRLRDELLEEEG